jgi:hypothetical protein
MNQGIFGTILGGVGSLIGSIGHRRDVSNVNRANTAEDARQEAEMRRRAQGRAALMRGILNANGYGETMTDDQIFDSLMRTPRRGAAVTPSLLTSVGSGIGHAGDLLVAGSSDANPTPTASPAAPAASFYDLLRLLEGENSPRAAGLSNSLAGF